MAKYRLNIKFKYPEDRDYFLIFESLRRFDGCYINIFDSHEVNNYKKGIEFINIRVNDELLLKCKSSWIEEIKEESAFDKLCVLTPDPTVEWPLDIKKYSNRVTEDRKTFWQESEKKRDLLYRCLMEAIINYMKNKHPSYLSKIKKELYKIKVTLSNE